MDDIKPRPASDPLGVKPTDSLLHRAFKTQMKILLAGAAVVIPFILSIGVLWYVGVWIDDGIEQFINWVAGRGEADHIVISPGLGFLAAVGGIYMVGLLTRVYLFQRLVRVGEWIVSRIPLAKSLYEAVRDLLRFFGGGDQQKEMGRVVIVTLADGQVRMLGILTNEHPSGLTGRKQRDAGEQTDAQAGNNLTRTDQRVAVYLPMSYQLGGFTVYVEPGSVEPVDMSVEEAMKIAATADVG